MEFSFMFMLLLIVSLTFQSYKLFVVVWELIFFFFQSACSSPQRPSVQMASMYLLGNALMAEEGLMWSCVGCNCIVPSGK